MRPDIDSPPRRSGRLHDRPNNASAGERLTRMTLHYQDVDGTAAAHAPPNLSDSLPILALRPHRSAAVALGARVVAVARWEDEGGAAGPTSSTRAPAD